MEPASNSNTASNPLTGPEQTFVRSALESGLYEVAIAKVALEKATNPQIKAMASTLANEHAAANERLRNIVGNRMSLPQSVPDDKRQTIDRISQLKGAEFDRQFVQVVGLKDHEADIKVFEQAQDSLQDPGLKDFLQTTLPVLRHHLSMAQELARHSGAPSS